MRLQKQFRPQMLVTVAQACGFDVIMLRHWERSGAKKLTLLFYVLFMMMIQRLFLQQWLHWKESPALILRKEGSFLLSRRLGADGYNLS